MSLKNLVERRWVEHVEYMLVFDDGHGNGYAFPCDADGNLEELDGEGLKNLEYCKANPQSFARNGKVERYRQRYVVYAQGDCPCGETVILRNQYGAACECPRCGRWYNMRGDEISSPESSE